MLIEKLQSSDAIRSIVADLTPLPAGAHELAVCTRSYFNSASGPSHPVCGETVSDSRL